MPVVFAGPGVTTAERLPIPGTVGDPDADPGEPEVGPDEGEGIGVDSAGPMFPSVAVTSEAPVGAGEAAGVMFNMRRAGG
eukprot:1675277-Rhodomonas_salina.1